MWIEMFFIKFEGKIENVWGNHSKNKFLGWLRIQNEKVHVSKKKGTNFEKDLWKSPYFVLQRHINFNFDEFLEIFYIVIQINMHKKSTKSDDWSYYFMCYVI